MDELVALVMKKTGLSKEQATMAVNVVVDFLKKKLPPTMGPMLEGLLNNSEQIANAADMLGGLFSGAKKKK